MCRGLVPSPRPWGLGGDETLGEVDDLLALVVHDPDDGPGSTGPPSLAGPTPVGERIVKVEDHRRGRLDEADAVVVLDVEETEGLHLGDRRLEETDDPGMVRIPKGILMIAEPPTLSGVAKTTSRIGDFRTGDRNAVRPETTVQHDLLLAFPHFRPDPLSDHALYTSVPGDRFVPLPTFCRIFRPSSGTDGRLENLQQNLKFVRTLEKNELWADCG